MSFILQEWAFGLVAQQGPFQIVFGNRLANLEIVQKHFGPFVAHTLKQVHGHHVVESSPQALEADAHYTSSPHIGLCIQTADCMPLLVTDIDTPQMAAIHAGWKGVASQITLLTLRKLLERHTNPQNLMVWIGPHIRQKSFEVDTPVWESLQLSIPFGQNLSSIERPFTTSSSNKYYVDLEAIVRAQIQSLGLSSNQIISTAIDTKSNLDWHSYRRDKDQAGRNLSIVIRKE